MLVPIAILNIHRHNQQTLLMRKSGKVFKLVKACLKGMCYMVSFSY